MRTCLLAFVFGIWVLQQQANLPKHPALLLILTLLLLGLCILRRQSSANLVKDALQNSKPVRADATTPLSRAPVEAFLRLVSPFDKLRANGVMQRCLKYFKTFTLIFLCICLGFTWAAWRAELRLSEQLDPADEDKVIVVVGTVEGLPVRDARSMKFQFKIENAVTPKAQLPSRVNLTWYALGSPFAKLDTSQELDEAIVPQMHPGERWQLPVKLRRPHGNFNPNTFDYEGWLLERGISATGSIASRAYDSQAKRLDEFVGSPMHVIDSLRDQLRKRIYHALENNQEKAPQVYRDVLVALVVGEQRGIAREDWAIFTRTGIGHLISISGLHITMLAGLGAFVAATLWRYAAIKRQRWTLKLSKQYIAGIAGLLTAVIYTCLAGFQIPAQRTLYMLAIVVLALLSGRRVSVVTVMTWAILIVCCLDPWAVLSPGFYLSFTAVAIIVFAMQKLSREGLAVPKFKIWQKIKIAARVQGAVTLGLIPLTLLLFQQVSLASPIANAIAIPLISGIVTPLALTGSVLPLPLASWVLSWAHSLLVYLVIVLKYLSELSWAVWQAPHPSTLAIILASIATLIWVAPSIWRAHLAFRLLSLPLFIPLVLQPVATPPINEFRASVLDIGQGTAVLIETAKHRLLYDTGPMYSVESDAGQRIVLPWLRGKGIRDLDMLMISHSDADHVGGARSILLEIPTQIFHASLNAKHSIVRLAQKQGANFLYCERGQQWLWDGVSFEILHPDGDTLLRPSKAEEGQLSTSDLMHYKHYGKYAKSNAKSCTLRVSNGEQTILLTGDIEAPQETEIMTYIALEKLLASILLIPHHGSATSSTEMWIDAVKPKVALVQAGYRNRFGHPRADVMARYRKRGIPVFETAKQGAVVIETKGKALQIEASRSQYRRYWMNEEKY